MRGSHSAIYNTLKGVAQQGNKITLLYPTANYPMELENAREVNLASPPGFEIVPVNLAPRRSIPYYLKIIRDIIKRRLSAPPERVLEEFDYYLSHDASFGHFLLNSAFINAIKSVLSESGYDIIQVDYPRALKIIDFLDFKIPRVYVNHEIQSVRAMRTLEAEKKQGGKYEELLSKVSSVEAQFLKKYDSVIVLTETDARKLKEMYSLDSYVSPLAVDSDYFQKVPSRLERVKLIYSGSEAHYPNKDAVQWFCTDIVPILDRRLKDYKLYITGKYSDETRERFSSANVVFTGFVDDLRKYLSGAICVAPIRIGSGMRVKILEAMSMQCGVVSTSVGCEGLNAKDGENLLLAETAEDFADKVVRLAEDIDLYAKLGSAARELVIKNFSIQATSKRRLDVYGRIIRQQGSKYSA